MVSRSGGMGPNPGPPLGRRLLCLEALDYPSRSQGSVCIEASQQCPSARACEEDHPVRVGRLGTGQGRPEHNASKRQTVAFLLRIQSPPTAKMNLMWTLPVDLWRVGQRSICDKQRGWLAEPGTRGSHWCMRARRVFIVCDLYRNPYIRKHDNASSGR